jgi:plastocyanin
MTRRTAVAALATVAAFGVAAAPAAAAKKNEIVIKGDFTWRSGKSVKDTQRFSPRSVSVKSGATVTVRNRSKTEDPHTISFIEKQFIPTGFESPIVGATFAAHQPGGEEGEFFPKVDDGVAAADPSAPLAVNTLGTLDAAGDSEFIAPGQKSTKFVVTADKGSTLPYFCAIHPWMVGKIKVK